MTSHNTVTKIAWTRLRQAEASNPREERQTDCVRTRSRSVSSAAHPQIAGRRDARWTTAIRLVISGHNHVQHLRAERVGGPARRSQRDVSSESKQGTISLVIGCVRRPTIDGPRVLVIIAMKTRAFRQSMRALRAGKVSRALTDPPVTESTTSFHNVPFIDRGYGMLRCDRIGYDTVRRGMMWYHIWVVHGGVRHSMVLEQHGMVPGSHYHLLQPSCAACG